jgi:hypothetical protein
MTIGEISPYYTTYNQDWNGQLDEMRISSIARSNDWLKTEYINQSSPPVFFSAQPDHTATGAPAIDTLNPIVGSVGAAVTIQGGGFGSTQGTSAVTFNGTVATVTNWSDAAVSVTVPAGATSGNVVVTVNGVASNGMPFTVYQPFGSGYQYRQALILDHRKVANSDQADFPVLITGTFPYLKSAGNSGEVQNFAGYDIVFASDPQGVSRLDHEIDTYDPTTGNVSFWVRIPTLSHNVDTLLYMFYGNAAITSSQENKPGVWKNGYVGVCHGGTASVLNVNCALGGTAANYGATAVAGQIEGGIATSAASAQYVDTGVLADGLTAFTLEAWVAPTNTSNGVILSNRNSTTGGNIFMQQSGSGNAAVGYSDGNYYFFRQSTTSLGTTGAYHQVVGTHAAGAVDSVTLYIDGAVPAGTSWYNYSGYPTDPVNSGASLRIGRDGKASSPSYYSGNADEIRVSNVVRSADWIATEYTNQTSPTGFIRPLAISSLTPNAAPIGSIIAIQGSGFGTLQSTSSVSFNGTLATPASWSENLITVKVPVGTTSGNVVVTSEGATSNGMPFTIATGGSQTGSVSLGSSSNSSIFGTPVTFTSTVSPSSATGTVTFMDGTFPLGTIILTSGTAVYSVSTLPVGAHSITSRYSGDSNFPPSTSSTVIQTVTNPTYQCSP